MVFVHSLAIIGKLNEPLFLHTSRAVSDAESLEFQYLMHNALDIIEEKRGKKSSTSSLDMYFGQLYPVEDYRIFGYFSNTLTKIIAICDAPSTESDLREFFQNIYSLYVISVQNPFYEIGMPLPPSRITAKIAHAINAMNETM
mmetsp:Transcript_17897/g.17966  ORF Transcript_17897/g.17966 Transcript_17897/m.17966 type:complete len:143 (-) Transcript_17897:100-528(-)